MYLPALSGPILETLGPVNCHTKSMGLMMAVSMVKVRVENLSAI